MEVAVKPKLVLNIQNNFEDITNDWPIIDIARKRCPPSWSKVFEAADLEIKDISDILETDRKINGQWFPYNNKLFMAFQLTPLHTVKVVLLGQDPYHGMSSKGPQAQGLCFSVDRDAKIPSSLQNIYKELKDTVPTFQTPTHGDLTSWAKQGILLLNTCLTVQPGKPGSHKELWMGVIKKVITGILEVNPDCIFVMWGRKAQKVGKLLGGRGVSLEASHPSGYSARYGFFGCNHFNEINRILVEQGKDPIDWNV